MTLIRFLTWIARLWPGFTALWERGQWTGLATASAFGVLLNFALLTTFGPLAQWWSDSGWTMSFAAWISVLVFLVLATWLAWTPATHADSLHEESFREAQTHYLKGHWIEAETVLARLLAKESEDVEVRLLLASVLRRTARTGEARKMLTELLDLSDAGRWHWEIQSELTRIAGNENEPTSHRAPQAA